MSRAGRWPTSTRPPDEPLSPEARWLGNAIIFAAWLAFTWALAERLCGGSWLAAALLQGVLFLGINSMIKPR